MNIASKRSAAVAAACAGAAASLGLIPALLIPSAAYAVSPTDPVPGTNCNVAQVERATQVVAPEAIAAMDNTPGARDTAEQFITSTPDQRQAQLANLQQQNPLAAEYYQAHKQEIDAKIAKVLATCNQY
ncbi:hemophore-related protein [Tsukamurella soli]|uniref:Hemophore-related protein, Rv0203/Rv1174c family n=1 Tax=Tsukamurella soli TaxID=644556 RepID=A0ABP8K4S5_9ACTN